MSTKNDNLATNRNHLLKAGLWMSMLNALVLNIVSYHYLSVTPECEGWLEKIYLYSFSFTHFFFISLLPFILVYIPAALLTTKHRKRACMISGAMAYGIYLIFIIIDSFIYYLYRFHFNDTIVEQMLGPGAGQVFEFSTTMYIACFSIIGLIFLFQVLLFTIGYKLANKIVFRKEMVVALSLLGVYAICQIGHSISAAKGDRSITRCDRYFPLCKPLNINSQLVSLGVEAPLKYKIELKGHKFNYPKNPIIGDGSGKNIIFITLDSWTLKSLDSVNCPNIYQFSKKCNQFHHHYSGGNCTRNGVYSMMYGLPGMYWYDFLAQEKSPVLIDELLKNGYDIRLFPSASMQNPAFDKTAFVKVADQCGATEGDKAWQRDKNLAVNFINYLKNKESEKPFFAFLFFDSLHSMILPDSNDYKAPFHPTWNAPLYLEVGNNTEPTPFANLYRNMLHYIDGYIGQIIGTLEENGILENSIVIITGDHGQEFNENGKNFWGHNGNFSAEQVQVPLLYYAKDKTPEVYKHWSSHYDIVPTLMSEILGVKNPYEDYTIGHSLFDTTPREYMVTDGYNGLAITEKDGTITDIFYDGDYQITDKHLNHLLSKTIDRNRIESVMQAIRSFYKE